MRLGPIEQLAEADAESGDLGGFEQIVFAEQRTAALGKHERLPGSLMEDPHFGGSKLTVLCRLLHECIERVVFGHDLDCHIGDVALNAAFFQQPEFLRAYESDIRTVRILTK